MRRHLLLVFTAGLILAAILIALRNPTTTEKMSPTRAIAAPQRTSAHAPQRQAPARSLALAKKTPPPEQVKPDPPIPEDGPAGLQLSPRVPLPAAAIAQSDPALLTPAATALREQITISFYQDLAATFGTTATIQPGPEVDAALARANECYRSLFGDAAYQKQLLNSALEVRLPE